MMKSRVIAVRYADAFIAYAKETIGVEKALSDLKDVRDIMRQYPEFKELLEGPEVAFDEKCSVIDTILQEQSSEIRSLLKLLLEHGRVEYYDDIAEYARLTYAHEGEEEVTLRTTFPLDLALIQHIEQKLEEKFKQKFRFYIDLDSSLLGGIQVVMGNKVIDGSVRKRLDDLKEKLRAVKVG